MAHRVAWIESPLQLINAVEYAAASGDGLQICLRRGVPQLGNTGRAIAPLLPRRVVIDGGWTHALRSPFATSRHRLVGDALSGQVRSVVSAAGAGDAVLVDDGTSALAVADALAGARRLTRPRHAEGPLRRALGAVAAVRFTEAAHDHRLTVFTAYAGEQPMRALAGIGAIVAPNEYRWLQGLPALEETLAASHVVVGSAMVSDGLIRQDDYIAWVRSIADGGPLHYLPHRREQRDALRTIAELPGVTVHRPTVPVELLLAACPGLARVTTLPSSVIATLRTVIGDRATIDVHPVPERWWMVGAPPTFRDMIGAVGAAAALA